MLQFPSAAGEPPAKTDPSLCQAGVPTAVLKFGSSVLKGPEDLSRVAGEIYRQSLCHDRIIVIVSAYEGETDRLFSRFDNIAGTTDCEGCPDLVSLGEEFTAAQLRIACSRIGLDAELLRPEQWSIVARGSEREADPLRLPPLPARARSGRIIIIPGFVAVDCNGRRLLLGRGGSDMSAIFIGAQMNARTIRLYKDVDGVYDHDPASDPDEARKYETISWDECLRIARPLVQPHAVEYARTRGLRLEVGSISSTRPTSVGEETGPAIPKSAPKPLRLGIAGFGVVGQALYRRLVRETGFEVSGILVRDPAKSRGIYPPFDFCSDLEVFAAREFDVLIDVTCGEEAGFPLSCRQLERGRALVSANKTVIEPWYEELSRLSAWRGGHLGYSACVGGGTPILETIDGVSGSGEIRRVTAVLSGTVNYVLDELSKGQDFEGALQKAKEAGFAEDDPSRDLSGADAEVKLRLIARRAFGCKADDILIRKNGLSPSRAKKIVSSGKRWIQLATLERAHRSVIGSIGFVRFETMEELPPLPGERNFARLVLADGRKVDVVGRGAGGAPTAEAIMTDLHILRQSLATSPGRRAT